jgi:hypothetical protein
MPEPLPFSTKTAPQEVGQKALAASFAAAPINYPTSAMPLIVNDQGNPVTAGRQHFDRQLTIDLLTEIYGTNLSAQETIATAQLSEINALKALRQSRNRLVLIQADIASLRDRVRQENDPTKEKFLKSEISAMETSLSYEQADQKHFSTVLTLAHTATKPKRAYRWRNNLTTCAVACSRFVATASIALMTFQEHFCWENVLYSSLN